MKAEREYIELIYSISDDIRKEINKSTEEITDETIMSIVQTYVLNNETTCNLDLNTKKNIADGVFSSLRRELDFLDKYMSDSSISEIMVNGKDSIYIESNGVIKQIPEYFPSDRELEEIIMRIASKVHREINEMNPILDARLEDGSRVHAVYKNVALNGPTLNIRRFPDKRIEMNQLIRKGTITQDAADFLKTLVECGYNTFISGGTSSGKTTFLNALSDFIPNDERVIVIEDSAELQLDQIQNLVRMETKNANVQGKGAVDMRQLIKASLRMRPDRIIIGEVRGSEVVDMINSMNTGHSGSLSTGHANSAKGMISRLETMFLSAAAFPIDAIRGQIASAIDIMIHLGRMKDKSRKVLEITELVGYEDNKMILNPLYVYKTCRTENGIEGTLVRTNNKLINTEKIDLKGGVIG